jgi:hypothetical protein
MCSSMLTVQTTNGALGVPGVCCGIAQIHQRYDTELNALHMTQVLGDNKTKSPGPNAMAG